MKGKKNLPEFLLGLSILLMAGFILRLGADALYAVRGTAEDPFHLTVFLRMGTQLLPAGILMGIGLYLKRRKKRSEEE